MSDCEYPGLAEGLRIHRDLDSSEWKAAVEALDEELRAGAANYLHGIAVRHRTMVRFAREAECRSFEEFEDTRKQARRAGAPGARAWVRAGRPEHWRNGEL